MASRTPLKSRRRRCRGRSSVSVAGVRAEREVKLTDFIKWLERTNGASPREMIQRQRLRSILAMRARPAG
jgi:hypothetical protein